MTFATGDIQQYDTNPDKIPFRYQGTVLAGVTGASSNLCQLISPPAM